MASYEMLACPCKSIGNNDKCRSIDISHLYDFPNKFYVADITKFRFRRNRPIKSDIPSEDPSDYRLMRINSIVRCFDSRTVRST